ncbi:MAG: class I SAM-dependent methyltransferase [Chthonomonadales bacterium]|nr:class I SAM-dependent methyltransferase [Chthonomonadales bacterium]
MNTSNDWDVIWKWQWFRRAQWQPHYRDPNHAEGRPARATPIWSQALKQSGAERVLDCCCGLGLRAILLKEDGFDVTGVDGSDVAIRHAIELAEARELFIPFERCSCEHLGARFHNEFDAVIQDGLMWAGDPDQLRFLIHNCAAALKRGGSLIFTGPEQWARAEDRQARLEHAWNSSPRFQVRAECAHGGIHMTLVVARDREEFAIVEHYLFVVHENGVTHLETASIRNSMQWTWQDLQEACMEAGFHSVQTVQIEIGGHEHHINVAQR